MKRLYATDANLVFLISVVLSQCLIYLVAASGLRDGMVLQFLVQLFIAFPAVAYLSLQRVSFREGLMIHPIGWKEWLLLLPFAVCINKIAEFINLISQLFTANTVGNHMAELIFKYPFPIAFFVIAVVPAICEELVFRGVLYRGYRKNGSWIAIVLTAFLFGMMHMNPNQLFYAFVLGILFASVNEITGSILPSVLLHLYINGRSVIVLYRSMNYLSGLRERYVAAVAANDSELMEQLILSADGVPIANENWLREYMTPERNLLTEQLLESVPQVLLAVAGTALVLFLFWKWKRQKPDRSDISEKNKEETGEERGGLKTVISPSLIAGVVICIVYMIWR